MKRHFAHSSILKALFNNVFTLKNLSYMSLGAISVFHKVYKLSPEKINGKPDRLFT